MFLKLLRKLYTRLVIKFLLKEDKNLLIIFLAANVVMGSGGYNFERVPDQLKPAVYEELKNQGVTEIYAPNYTPPAA